MGKIGEPKTKKTDIKSVKVNDSFVNFENRSILVHVKYLPDYKKTVFSTSVSRNVGTKEKPDWINQYLSVSFSKDAEKILSDMETDENDNVKFHFDGWLSPYQTKSGKDGMSVFVNKIYTDDTDELPM